MHNKVWLQGRTGTMYIAAARSKQNLISLKAQGAFSTLSIETAGRSLPSLVKECSLKLLGSAALPISAAQMTSKLPNLWSGANF